MKIIAVNINKEIASGACTKVATERAWKLKLENCQNFNYVIGVAGGEIQGCYDLTGVHIDLIYPSRVKFDLTDCTPADESKIRKYISSGNILFWKITTKYIR